MSTATRVDTHESPQDDRARRPDSAVVTWLKSNGAWVLALDLVLIAYFSLASQDHVFWTSTNFRALALSGTQALILAMAVTMMLAAGSFDLSVGANLVLSSVVGAKVIQAQAGTPDAAGNFPSAGTAIALGFVAAVLAGLAFGLVNGLIIAYLGVNSLIATLGTMGIGSGLYYIVGDGGDIGGLPNTMQSNFTSQLVLGVPAPAVVALVLMIIVWATLRYTVFGINVLAIGSSRAAAARAGIRVRRHLLALAMFSGFCAALAGFIDIARYTSTSINGHANDGLAALTAVVIGGTILEGGRANVIGALWGTVLSVVLLNGLIIVGVLPYYQLLVTGVVLIVAVAIDQVRSRSRAS